MTEFYGKMLRFYSAQWAFCQFWTETIKHKPYQKWFYRFQFQKSIVQA